MLVCTDHFLTLTNVFLQSFVDKINTLTEIVLVTYGITVQVHIHNGQLLCRIGVMLLILFIMLLTLHKRLADPDCPCGAVVKVAMETEDINISL